MPAQKPWLFHDVLYPVRLQAGLSCLWILLFSAVQNWEDCGLWHGAAWTFIIWGLWHGLFSLLESLNVIPGKKLESGKLRILGHIYTLLVVCIGFVMFRASTVTQGLQIIGAMFAGFNFTNAGTVALLKLLNLESLMMLVIGIALSMPISRKLMALKKADSLIQILSYVGALAILVLCIIKMAAGDFAPSIYAQF